MYELTDSTVIRCLLGEVGFSFKKQLGQNFLIDPSVCPRMAENTAGRGVIEIGPGVGVLTAELARRAERVVAVELDERLRPVLERTLADFKNTEVVFGDAMKLDLAALINEKFDGMTVSVCANLPYYITSPLIMHLLESRLPIDSVTVMVQKEAAERLCAALPSREAGAVTAAVAYYAEPHILFSVPRTSFLPQPKVDSAVIELKIRSSPPVRPRDEKFFFSLIRAAFAMRRKTFVNSVSASLGKDKETIRAALAAVGADENVRAEQLSLDELCDISNILYEK